MILILSASLRADSNSRILARRASDAFRRKGLAAEIIDLRDHPLPLCDAGASYADPNVATLEARIAAADAILIATPIYNYDATGALKNLIEHTGSAWENKVVGFLCAAGGMSSYMSILSLANSLMLDFRSVIVPRFVYATADAFAAGNLVDPKIENRVDELVSATANLARALRPAA